MSEQRYCGCYVNPSTGAWEEGNEAIRHSWQVLDPDDNEFCKACVTGGCEAIKKRAQARKEKRANLA